MKTGETPLISGDAAGFVFPVYYAQVPVVVEDFIRNARFEGDPYIFAVVNGGGLFGRTLKQFERILHAKGYSLHAGFRLGMPGNNPKIAVINKIPAARYYTREKETVKRIAEIVKRRGTYTQELPRGILGSLLAFFLGFDIPRDYSREHRLDSFFWLNDNCVNCGTCVRLCPADNIVQTKRKPEWKHKCISCFACYNHCPWKGIQLKCPWQIFQFQHDAVQLPRYCHPEIEPEEING